MKLTRNQLRKMIINEVFGFGNKKKNMTPDEAFLDELKSAFDGKFKDYDFESIDDIIEVDDGRAAIGTSKSSNMQLARDAAAMDAMRKLKLRGTYGGIEKPFTKSIGGKTYMLVIAPNQ